MSSQRFRNARGIFRFPQETNELLTLEVVATTKIESPVTGADISADRTRLGLVAKDALTSFGSMATWRASTRLSHTARN